MFLRYLLITLIAAALTSGPVQAAKVLSDPELALVSGGGVEFSLDGQGLPQDSQQPNQQGVFSPGTIPQANNGMDRAPSVIVVLQSKVEMIHQRTLVLGQQTQLALLAMSLDNGYASDVVAATNVFAGRLSIPDGIFPHLNLSQGSELYQLYRQQGQLYSAKAGYRYETTVEQSLGQRQIENFTSSLVNQFNRQELYRKTLSSWDVEVGKVARDDLWSSVVSNIPQLERTATPIFPGFSLGGTVTIAGEKYGAVAKYNGTTLYGAESTIGNLVTQNNDLLIEATLKLPELDFGAVTGCFLNCDAEDYETVWDVGSVGGHNILSMLKQVDDAVSPSDVIAFSDEGIILKGMGSVLEEELNLNTGFVFTGKGRLELLGPASIDIGGEAFLTSDLTMNFEVDPKSINDFIEGATFGLVKNALPKWTETKKYSLIDITIPFTLFHDEIPPFVIEFDGVVLAQLGPGEVSAEELEFVIAEQSFLDNSRVEETFSQDFGESSYNDSYENSLFIGGEITAGQAELLAMSEGVLNVQQGSHVFLADLAQRDMMVLHGVNAVTSLAANSLNVATLPVMDRGIAQMSLQQNNQFMQQR